MVIDPAFFTQEIGIKLLNFINNFGNNILYITFYQARAMDEEGILNVITTDNVQHNIIIYLFFVNDFC